MIHNISEWLSCPECGSADTDTDAYSERDSMKYKVSCNDCGNRTWVN